MADVLEPGTTRFRGLLLYYLVRGLKRARRAGKNGRVGIAGLYVRCRSN